VGPIPSHASARLLQVCVGRRNELEKRLEAAELDDLRLQAPT
jgi:hypothetical protein